MSEGGEEVERRDEEVERRIHTGTGRATTTTREQRSEEAPLNPLHSTPFTSPPSFNLIHSTSFTQPPPFPSLNLNPLRWPFTELPSSPLYSTPFTTQLLTPSQAPSPAPSLNPLHSTPPLNPFTPPLHSTPSSPTFTQPLLHSPVHSTPLV